MMITKSCHDLYYGPAFKRDFKHSQIADSQNETDYGIQDADMDPYSDYKPPTQNANRENGQKPTQNPSRSPKEGRDGSSTEEAVSSPG